MNFIGGAVIIEAMSGKDRWLVWLIVAALIIIVAGTLYWQTQRPGVEPEPRGVLSSDDPAVAANRLNQALEQTGAPTVTVPSANPLEAALPAVNPLEEVNPFKNVYQNPFQ